MRNFILTAIFLSTTSCNFSCTNFSTERYTNDNFCKEYYNNDDDCIQKVESDFFNASGINSVEYLEKLHRGSTEPIDKELAEKFGAYLLGVSALYNDYSAFEHFLKSGVNPYLPAGTPTAGIVFVIQNKDMRMWQLVKQHYPIDKYDDSRRLERYFIRCREPGVQ